MICENCGIEHNGKYGSGRFCCKECARGFSTKAKRQEINQKVSKTFKEKFKNNFFIKVCPYCQKEFQVSSKRKKQVCCSYSCASRNRIENLREAGRKGGRVSAQIQSKRRRSKNEILFAELCKSYFKNVLTNEPIFNGWDSDIIIEDLKLAILWNGKWHYEKITKKHSIKQVQNRDAIKVAEIINCGYKPYIVKDMGKYNEQFVKEEFNKLINNIAEWCNG